MVLMIDRLGALLETRVEMKELEKMNISMGNVSYLEQYGFISQNAPLSDFTSYAVGGPADLLIHPKSNKDIPEILKNIKSEGYPLTIVGGGTNLLVGDKGIRGVVLRISEDNLIQGELKDNGDGIVYGDATIAKKDFVNFSLSCGYKGIEFMAGIPGSIGGGIIMNAGTNLGWFADILTSVDIVTEEGGFNTLPVTDSMSCYRYLDLPQLSVVTGSHFKLQRAENPKEIEQTIEKLLKEREEKHPLNYPSAGSVFKNPEGQSSWKLIDDSGLKGYRIGGAMVSELHTNFIINYDNATSHDIKNLIQHVQEVVNKKFSVNLETEIRMIGDF